MRIFFGDFCVARTELLWGVDGFTFAGLIAIFARFHHVNTFLIRGNRSVHLTKVFAGATAVASHPRTASAGHEMRAPIGEAGFDALEAFVDFSERKKGLQFCTSDFENRLCDTHSLHFMVFALFLKINLAKQKNSEG